MQDCKSVISFLILMLLNIELALGLVRLVCRAVTDVWQTTYCLTPFRSLA